AAGPSSTPFWDIERPLPHVIANDQRECGDPSLTISHFIRWLHN
ncbi:MAG: hypothetical protein ACI8PD_001924, partial [Nitrospinales bacterium]